MRTLKGKWYWNETIPTNTTWTETVNFTSYDWSHSGAVPAEYTGMYCDGLLWYRPSPSGTPATDGSGEWYIGTEAREIDFGTEPQEVSEEFYNFFTANAAHQNYTIAEKLQIITDNEQRVFDAGYEKGKTDGIEEGKQAEYDRFWDAFLGELPKKTIATKSLFAGYGWCDETFNPTKSFASNNAEMFLRENRITDYAGILKRNGVTFDFSQAKSIDYFAYNSTITHLPELNFSNATKLAYTVGIAGHYTLLIS